MTLLCPKKSVDRRLSQEEYRNATLELRASINKYVKLEPRTDLSNSNAFHEAEELSDKYRIDLSDTLQIVAMKRSAVAGATLITDRGLARGKGRGNFGLELRSGIGANRWGGGEPGLRCLDEENQIRRPVCHFSRSPSRERTLEGHVPAF